MKFALFIVLPALFGCISAASVPSAPSVAPSTPGNYVLALSGTGNCGIGEIRDVRLTGCSAAPCDLRRGQSYNIQVDFVPEGDREFGTVFFRSIVLKDNQIQTVTDNTHMPNVHLQPGVQYTLNWDFTIPSGGFTGNESELRLKVFQNLWKPLCLVIPSRIQ